MEEEVEKKRKIIEESNKNKIETQSLSSESESEEEKDPKKMTPLERMKWRTRQQLKNSVL